MNYLLKNIINLFNWKSILSSKERDEIELSMGNLIDNFIRKIKGNQNSENSLSDALESIRICDMISNSINKNGIVSKI